MNRLHLAWLALPLLAVALVASLTLEKRTGGAGKPTSPGDVSPEPPAAARLAPPVVPSATAVAVEADTGATGETVAQEGDPSERPAEARPRASAPSARFELVVRDAVGPAADVAVELGLTPGAGREELVLRQRTDAKGRLALTLEPGALRVCAWSPAAASPRIALELLPHTTSQAELELAPTQSFGGRVVDALTRQPVPGAEVHVSTYTDTDVVQTGADGTFEHPRFPCLGKCQQIRVHAAGYGPSVRFLKIDELGNWKAPGAVAAEETRAGQHDPWIEIALVRELVLTGRVADETGRPIAGASVTAEGFFRILPGVASRDRGTALTDDVGRFALDGLRSDTSHTLRVAASGHAEIALELPHDGPVRRDLGELRLARELLVAGVVVDAQGFGVADAQVRLVPIAADDEPARIDHGGLDVPFPFPTGEHTVRTDAAGAFGFEALRATAYRLTVERDDSALLTRKLVPGEPGTDGLALCLPAECLVLEGSLHDGRGPVTGATVELYRRGHVARTHTDAAGTFRVSGLDGRSAYTVRATWTGPDGTVLQASRSAFAFERVQLRPSLSDDALARAERD